MDAPLESLISVLDLRPAPSAEQLRSLNELAAEHQVVLPADYLAFMQQHDGGDGDTGTTWLDLWPVQRILDTVARGSLPYEDVLLFAGSGGNTIYGFDSRADCSIVEGDWFGLERHELRRHGPSLTSLLLDLTRSA